MTPNQKSDDLEEELGHGGRLMPVVEMASGVETMDHSGDSHGNGNDEDDSCEEEEDTLKLQ